MNPYESPAADSKPCQWWRAFFRLGAFALLVGGPASMGIHVYRESQDLTVSLQCSFVACFFQMIGLVAMLAWSASYLPDEVDKN